MAHTPTCHAFDDNAKRALADANLQRALAKTATGFPAKRLAAKAKLPEFEALRDAARDLRNHVIDHLDFYLERFEAKVIENGGQVHWCRDVAEAQAKVLDICRSVGARTVTKGKSMVGEEMNINDHLERHGIAPIETDLGEYIIQLRGEWPSHIIAPAIHVSQAQVADAFRAAHPQFAADRDMSDPYALLREARAVLREKFLAADVGITGANFLIAETGTSVIVTNEGNGDLTQILPRVHIVLATLEKVVPTLDDAATLMRVLARSITGQEQTVYSTFSTGPKRPEDPDGPEQYHVVLLDNGRSRLLGTEFRDILRCIRCGACLGHCPVYTSVGGHAYGWYYSGPVGSVLTPGILGLKEAHPLPDASTFCGRCESICPVRIPLPKLMRHWRERSFAEGLTPASFRWGLRAWAWLAKRPGLYGALMGLAMPALKFLAGGKGRFRRVPFGAGAAWTEARDLPAPQGATFQKLWSERGGRRS